MTEDKNENQRRHFTPEQKIAILKAHWVDQKPVSDLCDQHGIQPSQFYRWQQEVLERGKTLFESRSPKASAHLERRVAELEQKLARKNEVLSELMEEHVALKKSLGGS